MGLGSSCARWLVLNEIRPPAQKKCVPAFAREQLRKCRRWRKPVKKKGWGLRPLRRQDQDKRIA